MKRVKIFAGVIWAFLCLILILVLFPGLNNLSASVSRLPFMKIHQRYTGGEVAKQIVTRGCTLNIRKPVFKGLTGDRDKGFVQLDWRGNVPDIIIDTLDYDLDGVTDFYIRINRKESKTGLEPVNPKVKNIGISTPTSYGWAVRVGLVK